jgi:hypothetical protein
LVFSVNEEYSWLGYSFDSFANVTIAGNTTLTDLPDGNHSIVVYVNNTFGLMGKSEIVHFTVTSQKPLQTETEPFLLPLVIASIISVAVMGVGLLVYARNAKINVDNKETLPPLSKLAYTISWNSLITCSRLCTEFELA